MWITKNETNKLSVISPIDNISFLTVWLIDMTESGLLLPTRALPCIAVNSASTPLHVSYNV